METWNKDRSEDLVQSLYKFRVRVLDRGLRVSVDD